MTPANLFSFSCQPSVLIASYCGPNLCDFHLWPPGISICGPTLGPQLRNAVVGSKSRTVFGELTECKVRDLMQTVKWEERGGSKPEHWEEKCDNAEGWVCLITSVYVRGSWGRVRLSGSKGLSLVCEWVWRERKTAEPPHWSGAPSSGQVGCYDSEHVILEDCRWFCHQISFCFTNWGLQPVADKLSF